MSNKNSTINEENIIPTCGNCAKAPGFGECKTANAKNGNQITVSCNDHEFVLGSKGQKPEAKKPRPYGSLQPFIKNAWFESPTEIIINTPKKLIKDRLNEAMENPAVPERMSDMPGDPTQYLTCINAEPLGDDKVRITLEYAKKDDTKPFPDTGNGEIKIEQPTPTVNCKAADQAEAMLVLSKGHPAHHSVYEVHSNALIEACRKVNIVLGVDLATGPDMGCRMWGRRENGVTIIDRIEYLPADDGHKAACVIVDEFPLDQDRLDAEIART